MNMNFPYMEVWRNLVFWVMSNAIFQKYFKPKFPVLLHIKEFFKVKSAIFLQEMQICDPLLLMAGLMQTNNVAKCLPLFCSPDILKNTLKLII